MQRIFLLLLIAFAFGGFIYFDAGQYLNLEYFNTQKQAIESYRDQSPVLAAVIYFAIYVLLTAFSLPGATVMTLAGGAIFGFGLGLLLVSFASSIGATLAFLIARGLVRDWVQQRFGKTLRAINQGVEKDGVYYLLTLRLVPLFPFFVINLAMALTPIKAWSFYWVSQLGMLVGTAVYVNAGTRLAAVENIADILSVPLIASFALLGLFPWLAKVFVTWLRTRMAFKKFNKPKRFDNNLLVIGAGSAGLVSAYIAAAVKARVTLVEKHQMGGDCLNTGCVPSKALIRSSRIHHYLARAAEFGIHSVSGELDFPAVMSRVQGIIAQIEPHDSVERYTSLGVNCVHGTATIVSPWEVELDTGKEVTRVSARNIIIASGGRPLLPDIPGLSKCDYLTSDSIWQLTDLPQHLIIVGGGPIGCELAQAFVRLGSEVTMIVRSRLLPKEDREIAKMLEQQFVKEGIHLLQNCHIVSVESRAAKKSLRLQIDNGDECVVTGDQLLIAVGRQANTEQLGLENVAISRNSDGSITVDRFMRTTCPTIFACGDVAGPYQFTHVASHQAWYAAVNALFGSIKKFKVDYSVIPWVTFCDPEVARVGLNEQEANARGIAYEVTTYGIEDLDRAIADGEAYGLVKILTVPGKDKILGVTIIGYHASEQIAEYVLAMRYKLGLNKVMGTIHIYPTFNEANKYAAGNWKRAHQPMGLLRLAKAFHRLRR